MESLNCWGKEKGVGGHHGKKNPNQTDSVFRTTSGRHSFHFVFRSVLFVRTFQGILMALTLFDENVCVISIPTQQNCQRCIREERESAN